MLMALTEDEDGFCGASRATNCTAELQASIAASLWVLQSGLTASDMLMMPRTRRRLLMGVRVLG